MSTLVALPVPVGGRRQVSLVLRALRLWRTRIGLAIAGALIAIAIVGPYLAPFGPQDFAGSPYQPAGGKLLFGADGLGQDVWSRFLYGGRSILVVSALATILGVGVGVLVGLSAALARRAVDDLLMRAVDLLLAFPSILLALVAVATVGPKSWLIVVAVAATTMPRTARVIRGAGVSVVERDFVTAARAIGDGHFRVLFFEVLPNVTGTLVVEVTLRLTYAIGLFEIKENFAAIGLALLPAYWYFWNKAPEFTTTRKALTAIYFFTIWYNFIAGHLLNNVRGFA